MDSAINRAIVPIEELIPLRLSCGQVWSGNHDGATLLELPGFTAWAYSVAAGPGAAGGDVHYVSVCPLCRVTRIALADVSGHGATVATFAEHLRVMMERHLHLLKQVPMMRDLSQAVRKELAGEHYATMVTIGWHGRYGVIATSNAGHPPPLWFNNSQGLWGWLESECSPRPKGLLDLPLGLLDDSAYDAMAFRARPGDLFILYSDGISETVDSSGNELGRNGLMEMVQSLDHTSVDRFGTQLVSALNRFRGGAEQLDDQTLIVIQRNDVHAERV